MYIYWGTVGFTLRVPIQGKLTTIIDAYPEWAVSLVRKSDAEKMGASSEKYQRYYAQLDAVPNAVNTLSTGKKYLLHENLTADDLAVILDAATQFSESLRN